MTLTGYRMRQEYRKTFKFAFRLFGKKMKTVWREIRNAYAKFDELARILEGR